MIYVDPFLGAGAVWLGLLDPGLVPLVSWMGGKRRLARDLLALLDLRPGRPIPALLGDASWWGWVWPTVLDAETGPRVSEVLRSWRGEDMEDRAEAAAQLLWLQARAASGVPVWWEGSEVLAAPGDGRERQRAADRGGNGLRKWDGGMRGGTDVARQGHANERTRRLLQEASTQIDDAGQRQASDLRLVKTNTAGDKIEDGCCKGNNARGAGGIVDPGTIAARADAIRGAAVDTTILHTDARTLTDEWAPRLGKRALVYLDPPYQGATGYPVACPRVEVLAIAETWARHGAHVVLSEAVPLVEDLGPGWGAVCLRATPKQEWATVYGCDVRAVLPPLLAACGGAA